MFNKGAVAVMFSRFFVGWVERKKDGGFRYFAKNLHNVVRCKFCVISETHDMGSLNPT